MITFKNQVAQGDVLFTKIDSLPSNLELDKPEGDNYIVAHSETSHHHVMTAKDVDLYKSDNPFLAFLVVNNQTVLMHMRSFDTHKPIMFNPGIYQINRQREYIPNGFRRALD